MKVTPRRPKLGTVSFKLEYLILGSCLLVHAGRVQAESAAAFSGEFHTAKYVIGMHVTFPAPYEGKRLVVYRSADPQKADCLSVEIGASGCTENFVGAIALVRFTANRADSGKPAAASLREVVTLVDQSPGLPDRPPFAVSIKLVNGTGSDLQVFGYDESPAPPAQRPVERERARAFWRRFRQDLYMDKDPQPFAVIEWLHTTTGISILRAGSPVSSLKN